MLRSSIIGAAGFGGVEPAFLGDRGVTSGGWTADGPTFLDVIDYVSIPTTGNSTDFGDLTIGRSWAAGLAGGGRGVSLSGRINNTPTRTNVIDYITISTTGNATDFGDLTVTRAESAGFSGD